MITIFNKMLLDSKKFASWEAVIASGFCSLSSAYYYQAGIASSGVYDDNFYTISEDV